MDIGAWQTRGSVWLALSLYVAGELVSAGGRGSGGAGWRWPKSVGCVLFLAHVVCAFHLYHHWTHAAAYADTAQHTTELTGWNWGGGLYLNYALGLVWLGEVFWAWANPNGCRRRANWMTWTVRGFFWFMIFNGAVVFVPSAIRWYGLAFIIAV
jgi:hypothetical protein